MISLKLPNRGFVRLGLVLMLLAAGLTVAITAAVEALQILPQIAWIYISAGGGAIAAGSIGVGLVLWSQRLRGQRMLLAATEALKESDQRFYVLLDHSPLAIFVHLDGIIVYANEAALNLYGAERPEQFLGHQVLEFIHEASRELVKERMQKTLLSNTVPQVEEINLRVDGSQIDVETTATPYRFGDKSGALVFVQDITERKHTEREMQAALERERMMADLVRYASVPIAVRDHNGLLTMCNPAFLDLIGYSIDELQNNRWNGELTPIEWHEKEKQAIAELERTQKPVTFEKEYYHKSGWRIPVELLVHPISDSRGTVRYYSAFIRDISERKAIEAAVRGYHRRLENEVSERTQELQRAQDKLVIQERLATLGQLAGSIAHELRNPLGVISNSVVYLRMIQPDAPEKVKEYLDIIQHETTVSAEIIRVLLDFARYNTANPQPVVIREIIERVLARVPMPQSMNVQLNLPDGLPPANIDARQIEQVIGNLLTNAIQAMTDPIAEGQPDYHPPAEPQLTITARLQDSFICVKIQDNGHGITEENQKRLFEPLFTTRLNGIGLGLALSRKLLDANQGRIEVSSRVGHGSTFSVFLPVSQEAA